MQPCKTKSCILHIRCYSLDTIREQEDDDDSNGEEDSRMQKMRYFKDDVHLNRVMGHEVTERAEEAMTSFL